MTLAVSLFLGQEKGLEVLKLLSSKENIHILQVYISTDSNVMNDYSIPIQEFCASNDISVGMSPRNNSIGYAIAVGYRRIIDWQEGKLIILHDSLLPKYRGFAPVPTMLINGETEIGVSAFIAKAKYDTGPILCQSKTAIEYPITIKEALERNIQNYLKCIEQVVWIMERSKESLEGVEQDNELATYSLWRDSKDYDINWTLEAQQIVRFIDAVGEPYDGARTYIKGKAIRVQKAEYAGDVEIANRDPGKVIWWSTQPNSETSLPTVVCGTGLIKIVKANFEDSRESIFPLSASRVRFG